MGMLLPEGTCYKRVVPRVVDPVFRRQAIAEAVFRVVLREGVQQASLRNVAEEAGLAIGSVRHYFATHDEVLVFAMSALAEGIGERVAVHVDQIAIERDRAGVVERMLCEVLPLDARRRDEAVLWLAFATAARTRPSLLPQAERMYDGLRFLVGRILERTREAGQLAPDVDVELEVQRTAAFLDGMTVGAVLHPDRMTPELMLTLLRRHLAQLRA
jgi:DNA-binding transcriptional regulator YbjK